MNEITLDINKSGQIINEPVVLRVGEKDQTITVKLLKDGQAYTNFSTATFNANKQNGSIIANDPADISNGVITYSVPQKLVNEFGKITNAYFLIDGKTTTQSFVIAVLKGVNLSSDDLNDYIPGMDQLNVIYDKWKVKLQTIADELAGIDAPKEVKNVIDNELKNYTDQINELQRRITALKTQLDALEVPVNAVGTNLLLDSQTQMRQPSWFTQNTGWTWSVGNWGSAKGQDTYLGSNVMYTKSTWDNARYSYKELLDRGVINTTDDFTYSIYFRVIGEDPAGMSYADIHFVSSATTKDQDVPMQLTSLKEGQWTRLVETFKFKDFKYDPANDYGNAIRFEMSSVPKVDGACYEFAAPKLEKGSVATDYSLNPEDILGSENVQTAISNALGEVDVGKTITATDDTGKTVNLKITGIS